MEHNLQQKLKSFYIPLTSMVKHFILISTLSFVICILFSEAKGYKEAHPLATSIKDNTKFYIDKDR